MPNDILKTYLEAKRSGVSEQNAIAAVRQNPTAAASVSQNTQTQDPTSRNLALDYLTAKRQGMSEKEAIASLNGNNATVSMPSTQSRLYDDKSNKQTFMEKARSSTADSFLGDTLANWRLNRLTKKYGDKTFDDNFIGQFRANYGAGKISQEYALAYSDYMDNPTKENYEYAVAMRNLYNQMVANNQEALDDENVKAEWLSKQIAGYLPQLGNQLKTSLPYAAAGIITGAKTGAAAGAAAGGVIGEIATPIPFLDALLGGSAGAVVGGIAGAISNPLTKAGLTVGSGVYSYDTMRGMAFANLVDKGADEAKAKDAANDEALISAAIEMGDTAFDLFTKIPGIDKTLKGLSEKATKSAITRLAKELASYGWNVGQEYGEEYVQEIISMANERRVARGEYDSGINGLIDECIALAKDMRAGNAEEERAQAKEAGKSGAIIGAVMGAGRTGTGYVVNRMNEATIQQNLNKVLTEDLTKETDENLTRLRDLADNKKTKNEKASEAIQMEQARREEVKKQQEEQAKRHADLNKRLDDVAPERLNNLTEEELYRARAIAERLQNYAAIDKIDDAIYKREEDARIQARNQQAQAETEQGTKPETRPQGENYEHRLSALKELQRQYDEALAELHNRPDYTKREEAALLDTLGRGVRDLGFDLQAFFNGEIVESDPNATQYSTQPTPLSQADRILQQVRGAQSQNQEQDENIPLWEQDQQTELTEEQRAAWEESRQLANEINQAFKDIYGNIGQQQQQQQTATNPASVVGERVGENYSDERLLDPTPLPGETEEHARQRVAFYSNIEKDAGNLVVQEDAEKRKTALEAVKRQVLEGRKQQQKEDTNGRAGETREGTAPATGAGVGTAARAGSRPGSVYRGTIRDSSADRRGVVEEFPSAFENQTAEGRLRGATVGEVVTIDAADNPSKQGLLETRALPELGINDNVIEIFRNGDIIHAEANMDLLAGSEAQDDGTGRVGMYGTTRPLYGQERRDFLAAHPELDLPLRFLDTLTGNRCIVCISDGVVVLRSGSEMVGGLVHRANDGSANQSMITALDSAPHEVSHWIRYVLNQLQENLGNDYTADLTNENLVPDNVYRLLEDYLRVAYPAENANNDTQRLADEFLSHVLQGRQFSWLVKADSTDSYAEYLRAQYGDADFTGKYFRLDMSLVPIARNVINSAEFFHYAQIIANNIGNGWTAQNIVQAYNNMLEYNASQHSNQAIDNSANPIATLCTAEELRERGLLNRAERTAKSRDIAQQARQGRSPSNSDTSSQNDVVEVEDDKVEQKPASRPTGEELNELYGERMREQEGQEEAPPHTDEDIPHSETEFDDGRPVPQKAPRETKPWENYRHAEEYAKARQVEQGKEETEAQHRYRQRKKLRDMYGANYNDVVYGAKRIEKQKFYFEDEDSGVDTESRGYKSAVKGAEKFREHVNALAEGRITIEQFADYYLSMAKDSTMAEFYSDYVAKRMEEVKLNADKVAESPNPAHVRAYQQSAARAVKAFETSLSQANTARREMLQIASQLVKHAPKTKSGKVSKAAKKAAAFYTRWQISPGNVFRMIDGFDKSENGIGYQIQKEIDKATAKHQKTIAKAQMQFLKLRDMKGYADFANGTSRSSVKVAGADLSQQEAAHLIRLIDTLSAKKNRLGNVEGFARKTNDGEYEFLELRDIVGDKDAELELDKLRNDLYRSLDDVAKAYLDISAEVLDELGKENADVQTTVYGVAPELFKKGKYMPVHYGSKADYQSAAVDTDPVNFGSMEERTRTSGGYVRIQPISMAVDSYVNQSANHIAYAELGKKLELMNGKSSMVGSLSELMGEHFTDQYAKWMDNYVKDITDFHQADSSDSVNRLLGKGRRALQTGALWGSVSVPMKQISSYWSSMGVLSPEAVIKAYRSKFVRAKGSAGLNELLQYRKLGNIDPTVSDVLKADFLTKLMNKSKVMNAIGNAISTMDVRTVDNLYAATVLDTKLKNPGMDVNSQEFFNAVEEKFEEVVINTQPIYTKNARAEYARTNNELIKIMSMFRTQQTQNFNRLITTIGEYKASKNKSTGIMKLATLHDTIKGQAIASLSLALLSIAADWILHKQKKYEDDEGDLDLEKLFDRFAMNAVESATGTAWFGDQAAKWLIDQMSDGETNEFYGLSLGPINTIQTALERVAYFVESPTLSNARYVAGYIAQLFGIPLNNAYQFLNSAVMYTADAAGKNKRDYDDVLKMLDKEAIAANWKTDSANANVLLNAYLSGKTAKEKKVFELLGSEDSKSALKSAAKSAYVDGTMDRGQAQSFLEKYLFPKEEQKAVELLEEWQMQRDTGIAYDKMGEAYLEGRLTRGDVIEYRMTYGGDTQKEAEEYVAKQEFKKQYDVSYNDMKELYRSGDISREDAIHWRVMCGSSEETAKSWVDAQDVYLETGYEYTSSGSTSYMDSYSTKERIGTNTFYAKYGDRFKVPSDFGKVFNALNNASDNDFDPLYYMYKGEESELGNKQRGVVYLLNGFINDGTITRELADRIWQEYFGYSTWRSGAYQFLGNPDIAHETTESPATSTTP